MRERRKSEQQYIDKIMNHKKRLSDQRKQRGVEIQWEKTLNSIKKEKLSPTGGVTNFGDPFPTKPSKKKQFRF